MCLDRPLLVVGINREKEPDSADEPKPESAEPESGPARRRRERKERRAANRRKKNREEFVDENLAEGSLSLSLFASDVVAALSLNNLEIQGLGLPLDAQLDHPTVWDGLRKHKANSLIYLVLDDVQLEADFSAMTNMLAAGMPIVQSVGIAFLLGDDVLRYHVSVYRATPQQQLIEVFKVDKSHDESGPNATLDRQAGRYIGHDLIKTFEKANLIPPCAEPVEP